MPVETKESINKEKGPKLADPIAASIDVASQQNDQACPGTGR